MRAHRRTAGGRRQVTVLALVGALSMPGLARGEDTPAATQESSRAATEPTPARVPAASPARQKIDDERPAPRAPSPEPEPTAPSASYGGQIVLADLGALLVGGFVSTVGHTGVPLVATWTFASPAVHLAHNHPGTAAGSALLHLGLPVLGAFAGAAVPCSNQGSDVPCDLGGAVLGVAFGMIGATVLDAAVLARFSAAPSNRVARADDDAGWPELSVGPRRHLALAWRGRF